MLLAACLFLLISGLTASAILAWLDIPDSLCIAVSLVVPVMLIYFGAVKP